MKTRNARVNHLAERILDFAPKAERKILGDKTRDKLCSHLCAMGVDARIAERGRLEERLRTRWSSLGLIAIGNSPICWGNVLNQSGPGRNKD